MTDIYELIRKFNNDESVIKLKNYYNSYSFMEIFGVDRNELVHSSFLSWLFNSNINYDLNSRPLILLLDLLIKADNENKFPEDDKNAIILRQANINLDFVKPEYSIGKDGRVDIYIQFNIKDNQYAIIIENKVEAHEREIRERKGMQTEIYYNHFSKENNNIKYIYVFLAPSFNGKETKAASKEFINISYNDIVRSIISPILSDDNLLGKTRLILEDYLKVLSKPNIIKPNSKSISMLGFETLEYEEKLINNIKNNNKELGELLTSDDENEIIKSFMDDTYNYLIVTSTWPEIIGKKSRNRTFAELDIEEGTILYLAKSSKSNEINPNIYVRTEDKINQVSYTDHNGKKQYGAISTVAKILLGVNHNVNGFRYFVYHNGNQYINLSKIERK